MRIRAWAGTFLAAASLAAADASAQTVQLAPFAGYQFGGSFTEEISGLEFSLGAALSYGGTVDVAISKHWRVELLYSRQETDIGLSGGAPAFNVNVERYMAGIVEEKGEGRSHFFGAANAGVTRFVPGLSGFATDSRFTISVSLGLKHFLSDNFGLRAEARGFYTVTKANGGVFCAQGTCLFAFNGNGLWQGDVSGGIILAF